MKTKLLSFVGTGRYEFCTYEYSGIRSQPTKFAQVALTELLVSQEVDVDEILVFVTDAAWEKHGAELGEELKQFEPDVQHRFVPIADKVTAERIWSFFDEIYKEIGENERIFFDITHGFRSYPLTVVPILQYARELNQIKIGGIFYGNYEASWKEEPEQLVAPMDNLTDLISFLDWSYAINTFIDTGNANQLAKLSEQEDLKVFRAEGQTRTTESRRLTDSMVKFNSYMETCRAQEVVNAGQAIKQHLLEAMENTVAYHKPLRSLLHKVEEKMKLFTGDVIMDQYYAALWCIEHGLSQQAYTLLQEHVITSVSLLLGLDINDLDSRMAISRGIAVTSKKKPKNKWRCNEEERRIMEQTNILLKPFEDMLKDINKLGNFRNDMNHAGYRRGPSTPEKFEAQLKVIAKNLEPLFRHIQETLQSKSESAVSGER